MFLPEPLRVAPKFIRVGPNDAARNEAERIKALGRGQQHFLQGAEIDRWRERTANSSPSEVGAVAALRSPLSLQPRKMQSSVETHATTTGENDYVEFPADRIFETNKNAQNPELGYLLPQFSRPHKSEARRIWKFEITSIQKQHLLQP